MAAAARVGEGADAAAGVPTGDVEFDTDTWRTPPWLFDALVRRYGRYELDAAADAENARCAGYIDAALDALNHPWVNAFPCLHAERHGAVGLVFRVFCNPPYSKPNLPNFTAKAAEEGRKPGAVVTLVVPNTRDAVWMHDNVFRGAGVMENDRIRLGVDEFGEERWAQWTRYDANGCYVELIEIEQRVRFHRPLPDGTWGPTGSPSGGTQAVTWIAKVRA